MKQVILIHPKERTFSYTNPDFAGRTRCQIYIIHRDLSEESQHILSSLPRRQYLGIVSVWDRLYQSPNFRVENAETRWNRFIIDSLRQSAQKSILCQFRQKTSYKHIISSLRKVRHKEQVPASLCCICCSMSSTIRIASK